ncbi:hypothetical protein [Candidatus Lokiarchaeum ossiferum]|uniref:hypothetical protein n=1 Tax=Candidatus Lokiarchaeum ossiferum TaxID=2951803 RepID=UPI00352F715D
MTQIMQRKFKKQTLKKNKLSPNLRITIFSISFFLICISYSVIHTFLHELGHVFISLLVHGGFESISAEIITKPTFIILFHANNNSEIFTQLSNTSKGLIAFGGIFFEQILLIIYFLLFLKCNKSKNRSFFLFCLTFWSSLSTPVYYFIDKCSSIVPKNDFYFIELRIPLLYSLIPLIIILDFLILIYIFYYISRKTHFITLQIKNINMVNF